MPLPGRNHRVLSAGVRRPGHGRSESSPGSARASYRSRVAAEGGCSLLPVLEGHQRCRKHLGCFVVECESESLPFLLSAVDELPECVLLSRDLTSEHPGGNDDGGPQSERDDLAGPPPSDRPEGNSSGEGDERSFAWSENDGHGSCDRGRDRRRNADDGCWVRVASGTSSTTSTKIARARLSERCGPIIVNIAPIPDAARVRFNG